MVVYASDNAWASNDHKDVVLDDGTHFHGGGGRLARVYNWSRKKKNYKALKIRGANKALMQYNCILIMHCPLPAVLTAIEMGCVMEWGLGEVRKAWSSNGSFKALGSVELEKEKSDSLKKRGETEV